MPRVFRPQDNLLRTKCAEYSLDVPGYYDDGGQFVNRIMSHKDGKRHSTEYVMAGSPSNHGTTLIAMAMSFAEMHGIENAAKYFSCIEKTN